MIHQYYAHSLPGKPPEEWQPLEEHLKKVTELVRSSAESFVAADCKSFGSFFWLDIGKPLQGFQDSLSPATDGDERNGEETR